MGVAHIYSKHMNTTNCKPIQLVDPIARLRAEATELLRNATFQDGLGTILTQDAEALEKALSDTAVTTATSSFVVYSSGEELSGAGFWSNQDGWGTLDSATRYTADERDTFNLPISGANDSQWMALENDLPSHGFNTRGQSSGSPVELIVVTVANGDVALFVNSEVVYSLEATDKGPDPATLGESLAKCLGVELQQHSIAVPTDSDWTWSDLYELLPEQQTAKAESPDDGNLLVSLDGGVTYRSAIEGVRVIYKDLPIDDREETCELHLNCTSEGVIHDVVTTAGHIAATSSEMADDITCRLLDSGTSFKICYANGDYWTETNEDNVTRDLVFRTSQSVIDAVQEFLTDTKLANMDYTAGEVEVFEFVGDVVVTNHPFPEFCMNNGFSLPEVSQ